MSNDNTIRNTKHKHKTQTHTQTTQTTQWFSLEVKQKNNKRSHSKGSKCIANVKTLYPKIEIKIEHPS